MEYMITVSGNLLYDISDHLPNFLVINKIIYTSFKPTIYRRNYSLLNEESLLSEVKAIDWEEVFPSETDTNTLFDSFLVKVTEIVDKHAEAYYVIITCKSHLTFHVQITRVLWRQKAVVYFEC